MRRQIGVVAVVGGLGLFAWLLASRLSSDALGMAIGLVFGVLSGVPTALLVMAAGRQRDEAERRSSSTEEEDRLRPHALASPYQPPVVVLIKADQETQPKQETHYHVHNHAAQPAAAAQPQGKKPLARRDPYWDLVHPPPGQPRYRVVGEREEWVE